MPVARKLATVGSATLLSRLLGFVRDAGVAALLGAGPLADAYVAALQIPNLFRRLLADGALNAAFVPAWLRLRETAGLGAAWSFSRRTALTMLLGLGAATVICILFAPAIVRLIAPGFSPGADRFDIAVILLRLSIPYIVVAGLCAIAVAILNAEGRVGAAAGGIVAFNCVLVAAVFAIFWLEVGPFYTAALLAISFVAAGFAQIVVVGLALMRIGTDTIAITPPVQDSSTGFFSRALPGIIAAGTPQLVLIAATIIVSPSPAAASWLYYASRLYELPLGVVSIAVAAVLAPRIAESIVTSNRAAITETQSRAFEITLGIALPAAAGLAILSTLIVGVLFERGAFGTEDTLAVAAALAAISAGLAGYALEKVLSAISFAHEDTLTPMFTALAGLAAAAGSAFVLFPRYGHTGVAGAIAISGWVSAFLLAISLNQRGWIRVGRAVALRIAGIAVAALIMSVVVAVAMGFAEGQLGPPASFVAQLLWLVLLIGLGIAVYLIALWQFGIADIRKILAAARDGA